MPAHPGKRKPAQRRKQSAPSTRAGTGRHKGNRKAAGRMKATRARKR